MVFAFQSKSQNVKSFFGTFRDVYFHHATDRECCSLLAPRPALLEAITRHLPPSKLPKDFTPSDPKLGVVEAGYFEVKDLCVRKWNETKNINSGHLGHVSNNNDFCGPQHSPESLQVECGDGSSHASHICADIDENLNWKKHINRGMIQNFHHKYSEFPPEQWSTRLPEAMWQGSLRFRNATSHRIPRKFCWETGNAVSELRPPSKVFHSWDRSELFLHPSEEAIHSPAFRSNLSIVLISGSGGGTKLEQVMYPTISKMYYAKRHGYIFQHYVDLPFKSFFDKDSFSKIPNNAWDVGYLSKLPMLIDTSFLYPHADWIIWTDDDTWPNPGWLYLPLDVYLADVPRDKVFVMSNYRSTFTNLIAIRNNIQGRRLLIDWLAVSMSGLIQCHGFDQAALQHLLFQRLHGSMSAQPFNHTCLFQHVSVSLTEDNLTDIGCDDKGDFSCDFNFERDMYFTGFKTAKATNFFNLRISSFTKGCANALVPEFHVVTESPSRPRWQCGHCTRWDRIEASGHWDGPWGGGNDKFFVDGAVNGWMFNHKVQFLFYELYLNPQSCTRMEDLLPPCHECKHSECKKEHEDHSATPNHVISLIDGLGYDLDNFTYCRISDPFLLKHQWTNTYMKDYQKLIHAANSFTTEKWDEIYMSHNGGEGRDPCRKPLYKDETRCHQDSNQRDMMKRVNAGNQFEYFEAPGYCQNICHVVRRSDVMGSKWLGNVKDVVDCRTEQDVNSERTDSSYVTFLKDPLRMRRKY